MIEALRRLAHAFALMGAAVALATGVLTVASIVGRSGWRSPIPGDVELTQFGIALAISLGLPWCQLRKANIIVDFFTQKLPPRRLQWLDGVGALLLAAMCALLAWRSAVGAVAVREAFETSMILSLPMWWVYASLAPGLALAAVVGVVQAVAHFVGRPLDTDTQGAA